MRRILSILFFVVISCLLLVLSSGCTTFSSSIELINDDEKEIIKYNNYVYEDDASGIFRFNDKTEFSTLREIGWIKWFLKKTTFYADNSDFPEFIVAPKSRIKLRSDINFLDRTMIIENNNGGSFISFSFSDIILEKTNADISLMKSAKRIGDFKAIMSENKNVVSYFSVYIFEGEYYLYATNGYVGIYKLKPEFSNIFSDIIS